MARRKLASILIRDGWTCIRGRETIFPLWKPAAHLDYMLDGEYTDLIVACNEASELLSLDTSSQINMVAALGWSGVEVIRELFESGYSKVFLGGADRQSPSPEEAELFAEMVSIYGASSFGYSLHFQDISPSPDTNFLAQFNEILLVHDTLQVWVDQEKARGVASAMDKVLNQGTQELNLCAPLANHQAWTREFTRPINYVNYCEHAIGWLR